MSPLTTYLVETFLALVAVIVLAMVIILGAKRFGIGRPNGPMRLLGRLPLDARRSVLLVQVADQVLVLGTSEAGITKLGELTQGSLDPFREPTPAPIPRFSDLLAALRNRPTTSNDADPSVAVDPTVPSQGKQQDPS